ncbi:MAG: LamG-like jellyroll fold domain-containing protein [Pirellulaceae bacterium]
MFLRPAAILLLVAVALPALGDNQTPPRIVEFLGDQPMTRVGRPYVVLACIGNPSHETTNVVVRLVVPEGVRQEGPAERALALAPNEEVTLRWTLIADKPLQEEVVLEVANGSAILAADRLPVRFLPALEQTSPAYIPDPQPVKTSLLVGAHNCPLWEASRPEMWNQLKKHPERTPALGFYAQENPEVADWETKWAVEHGVDFFIYCWYRTSQGGPVTQQFGSAIHEALYKSRFQDKLHFTIMWENQSRGTAGVANEADLLNNLLPFWMDNYFKHASYLKVDNKPVLFIYRPEFLVDDLGGVEQVRAAFEKMRQACRDAGFDGLWLLGEYRDLDTKHLELMKSLGLDYSFAYCWPVGYSPVPQQAIDAQMDFIRATEKLGIIPQVVTVSQAWSGWRDEWSIWKLPPIEFETLLRQAKAFVEASPDPGLGSKLLLLDNWNEWGEGHYILPYTEHGFGYLDAVRKVFSDAPEQHVDLIPEDIGRGPYDTAYRTWRAEQRALRQMTHTQVFGPGAKEAEGLVGWWRFDEEADSKVALDYAGNGLGAILRDSTRTPGRVGSALVCAGGGAFVPGQAGLNTTRGFTVECWVKTDLAGQSDKWIVNRMYNSGESGFRLGLAQGRIAFSIPQTGWSHHITTSPELPLGRWVHIAGTFDGKVMRIYMDGVEIGALDRPGEMNRSNEPLHLGTYQIGHKAFFTGALDEVRIWDRALSPEMLAAHVAHPEAL